MPLVLLKAFRDALCNIEGTAAYVLWLSQDGLSAMPCHPETDEETYSQHNQYRIDRRKVL